MQSVFYSVASLYVGDLHQDVNEALLYEKFSLAGPIVSIRICRDNLSGKSLGYAYINFHEHADAERALDTMNFDIINGRPCRIMWSQRDPSVRKSGVGNIFIKNLDKSIDNKALYDTFSAFGDILSCKIAMDRNGSKGYGFVHFALEESASTSIEKVNGMLLNGKIVFVGQFLNRKKRIELFNDKAKEFTNVYVKNFGENLDDAKMLELFDKFGTVLSCKVMCDVNAKSKGFGFVSYNDHESAQNAVNEMHGQDIGHGQILYVSRAQKKTERQFVLKEKYEKLRQERNQKYTGINLYVSNLDDKVDDNVLNNEFKKFGTITSAKVMYKNEISKGFGFVCFSSPEEATRAATEMHKSIVCGKPLYVAIAQRKEDRKANVFSQKSHQNPNFSGTQQKKPYYKKSGQNTKHDANKSSQSSEKSRSTHMSRPDQVVEIKSDISERMQPLIDAETLTKLAKSTHDEQRNTLGNILYEHISQMYPTLAPKVTGMLLEINISDIITTLESRATLQSKVEEAVAVLHAHENTKLASADLQANA